MNLSNSKQEFILQWKILENPDENVNNLTQLTKRKIGIVTERHSKSELIIVLKEKGHKSISTKESGAFIFK